MEMTVQKKVLYNTEETLLLRFQFYKFSIRALEQEEAMKSILNKITDTL